MPCYSYRNYNISNSLLYKELKKYMIAALAWLLLIIHREVVMSTAAVRIEKDPRMSRADENVLSLYLNEINKIPLLTRSEEQNLARAAAKGEQAAKDQLIKANLRFVVNVAKKYQNQGLPLADIISEGNIGLINAIERFDVSKGYHFISYAVW